MKNEKHKRMPRGRAAAFALAAPHLAVAGAFPAVYEELRCRFPGCRAIYELESGVGRMRVGTHRPAGWKLCLKHVHYARDNLTAVGRPVLYNMDYRPAWARGEARTFTVDPCRLDRLPRPAPEELLSQDPFIVAALERALRLLPVRDGLVVRARHGLLDGEQHTIGEIAMSLRVSSERIRQIEFKALRRLMDYFSLIVTKDGR